VGLPQRKPRERAFSSPLPFAAAADLEPGSVDPAAAPPPPPVPLPTTTIDEHLEFVLERFRFRGARAFIWKHREHLEVIQAVVAELYAMTPEEHLRNPGGYIRWRVRQELRE